MNQHAGLPETLLAAGRTFVMGIVLGLSGLVMHPYRGGQGLGGVGLPYRSAVAGLEMTVTLKKSVSVLLTWVIVMCGMCV